jgi:Kdo2-lipid IVA lauroyltransferase/acyltransferase
MRSVEAPRARSAAALSSSSSSSSSLRNTALYVGTWVAMTLAQALPRRGIELLTQAAAALALRIPTLRRQVFEGVQTAFPGLCDNARAELVRAHRRHLATLARDFVLAATRRPPPPFALTLRGGQVLVDALQQGRGVLLLSMHLGNWERVAQGIAAHAPLHAVIKHPSDRRFARWLMLMRGALSCIERDAPGAAHAMVRVLRKGHVLGIPADFKTRKKSILMPFFDRTARVAEGPATLALRLRPAVLVAALSPAGEVEIERLQYEDLKPNQKQEFLCRLVRVFELKIHALPHGWLWMHPRWDLS